MFASSLLMPYIDPKKNLFANIKARIGDRSLDPIELALNLRNTNVNDIEE